MKHQIENRQQRYTIIVLLIATTLVAFINIFESEFIKFDDTGYVLNNRQVQSGLTGETIKWAFQTNQQSNWHPLTWLSLAADYSMYGLSAKGFHTTNLLLHILNSVLLFLVFERMTKSLWQSAFVAFVFALHPLHVESVAWVSERKDVLSSLFWILTMGAYVLYAESENKKYFYFTILFFALGLLAKPMLVTLPFVLLLLDYWPLQRLRLGEALPVRGKKNMSKSFVDLAKEKIPFFLLSLISSIITVIVQDKGRSVVESMVIPMNERLANAVVSYVQYLKLTLFPSGLAIFYPHPENSISILLILGSIIILVGVSVLVWKLKRNHPYLFTGWCWFLGTLVPVIGIVQVGMQAMADRYMYIPLIGVSVMIAFAGTSLLKESNRKLLTIFFVLVVGAMMSATYMQTGKWKNSKTLFEHTLAVTSDNYLAHHILGTVALGSGKTSDAISHFREVIRIMPTYEQTYNNLGVAFARIGNLVEAEKSWRRGLELAPTADMYSNLGNLYLSQGKESEASRELQNALRMNPNHIEAHFNYGHVLARTGKFKEARFQFEEVLRLAPGYQAAKEALQRLENVK
ncbi:MAG: tetratricopeptide repeat protein [Ignavibacteriae bacterium]|nr:tetratricopeptide repeat protein [Ignavibacteriota bacterium]